jgi:hypothetical protein
MKYHFIAWLGLVITNFTWAFDLPGLLPLNTQQNPSGINWKQVSSPHFDVIYPEGLYPQAIEVISLLETLVEPVSKGLDTQIERIPIIFQDQTLNSNGFVTLAPRRSEFFTMPFLGPQLGHTEWLRTLSIHEFRHIVQFDKSRLGFARFLRFFLGDIGQALAIGWTIPPWYLEGDAVGIETSMTKGGRGRSSLFERDWRALLLDDQVFSYDQLVLGSFKRWTPNFYVTGYFFTTYLRKNYGENILNLIHTETMERGFNPMAFYRAVEKYTGRKFDDFYDDVLLELEQLWRVQKKNLLQDGFAETEVTSQKKDWVSHSFPQRWENHFFSYRQSLSDIGQYVWYNDQTDQEKILWTPTPFVQPFPFKIRSHRVATSEVHIDPRWGVQDFSDIIVRDLESNKLVYKIKKSKYTLPILNHDGDKLAVYQWSSQNGKIDVFDITQKKLLYSFPFASAQVILGMDWHDSQNEMILLMREGVYDHVFKKLNISTGEMQELARNNHAHWAYPSVYGDHVYFQSNQSGIDNIHRIGLNSGLEEMVTKDMIGAYHPSVTEEGLTYAGYTAYGLKPVFKPHPIEVFVLKEESTHVSYYKPLISQDGEKDLVVDFEKRDIPEKDYLQRKNWWNPHSWVLLAPPLSPSLSLSVRSTNLLNTLDTNVGMSYDRNESVAGGFAQIDWQYYYPLLSAVLRFGNRNSEGDRWQEGAASLGVTLPYARFSQAFIHSGRIGITSNWLNAQGRDRLGRGDLNNGNLWGGSLIANWRSMHRMAARDLYPPWGMILSTQFKSMNELDGLNNESIHHYAITQGFIPGLYKHHHFHVEAALENMSRRGYEFMTPILFSRGHQSRFFEEKYKTSVNYAFPIVYPEVSLKHIAYINRISANFFHDNLWGLRLGQAQRFESFGTELLFDTHFFRNFFGGQFGLRLAHTTEDTQDIGIFFNTGIVNF